MVTLEEWENRIDKLINGKPVDEAKRLRASVEFAKKAHEGAFRKSTHEPYIVHPYEVCLVAATVTDDVDVLIAALLHDVVEDTDYTAEDIRARFGDRVTSFVADESEDKMENIPKAMSWIIRKEKFLDHLKNAPVESKTICMSDKISNLRSTVNMHKQRGEDIWNDFNQKDPKRHEWYYRTIGTTIYDDFDGTEAFDEYKSLFNSLFGDKIRAYKSISGGFEMNVKESKVEDNKVYIDIEGRITSSNADDLYNSTNEIISDHPSDQIIFDLDELEMISSAGLRVFLRLKKSKVNFKLINATSEVYEVFDITGFAQMLDITRGYRKVSVDGCQIIGRGAKGIIYELDEETIIKVYHDPDCEEDIIRERSLSKEALILGVPTAIPFDIVRVGERLGSVFELVNAKSLTNMMREYPERLPELVKGYGELMRQMNDILYDDVQPIELLDMKDEIEKWADFAKENIGDAVTKKIDAFVADLNDEKCLLHGDGHPDNVMCTSDEMLFIDMDTLSTGDHRCDPAVVYTALVGYKVADSQNDFLPITIDEGRSIWRDFVKAYLGTDDDKEFDALTEFARKFAALRLYRRGVRKETSKPCFAQNMKAELLELFGE